METKEFYNIEEICKLFRISKITAYRWVKSGKLKSYKIGKSHLFKRKDIENLLGDNNT